MTKNMKRMTALACAAMMIASMGITGCGKADGQTKEEIKTTAVETPAGTETSATTENEAGKLPDGTGQESGAADTESASESDPMMGTIVGISVLIFAVVMYLMVKVMIDRSAQNIALMKVFGYRNKEIKKLYLDGNFYMIAVGALISVPLSKKLMDAMYPALVSNIACGMNLSFSWQMYAIIYAGIIITYLVINKLLVRKIYKVGLSDALKNRE